MTAALTIQCEGPDCDSHQGPLAESAPFRGWLRVTARMPTDPEAFDFCSWDCAMRYAATFPPPEVIEAADV